MGRGGHARRSLPRLMPWLALACAVLVLHPAPMAVAEADGDPAARLAAEREAARKRLEAVQESLSARQAESRDLEAQERALAQRLEALRRETIDTAAALQAQEEEATALELTLTAIGESRTAKLAELAHRRAEVARLVNGLTRLARRPAEGMIFAPGEAYDTWRAAALMGRIGPLLQEQAAALRNDLDELAAIESDLRSRRVELDQVVENMDGERRRLAALERELDRNRQSAREEAAALARQVAGLSRDAANVQGLLRELEVAERQERERLLAARAAEQALQGRPVELRPAALAAPRLEGLRRGELLMPVAGQVTGRFEQPAGPRQERRPGLTLAVREGAQVTAPADARVMFAGPFKGYGRILILAHGGGYHTLLAGFDRIDREVGDHVLAGEPVGLVSARPDGGNRPTLYLELRHEGKPVDPERWLAATNRKASG